MEQQNTTENFQSPSCSEHLKCIGMERDVNEIVFCWKKGKNRLQLSFSTESIFLGWIKTKAKAESKCSFPLRRGHEGAIHSGAPTQSTHYIANHRLDWKRSQPKQASLFQCHWSLPRQAQWKEQWETQFCKSAVFWGSLEETWPCNVQQTGTINIPMWISGHYWLFSWMSSLSPKLPKLKINTCMLSDP